jgi:DNA-directed RNA polymerase specialized sigma24 family protein
MTPALQDRDLQRQLLTKEGTVSSGVVQAMLMHALQLRRSCREVFLLCDVQKHTLMEAALILGISHVTAKRRLFSARQRMHEAIEHLWGDHKEGRIVDAGAEGGI